MIKTTDVQPPGTLVCSGGSLRRFCGGTGGSGSCGSTQLRLRVSCSFGIPSPLEPPGDDSAENSTALLTRRCQVKKNCPANNPMKITIRKMTSQVVVVEGASDLR